MGIGLLIAGICFGLLSAESASSKLGVTQTVQRNFRAAYDILVRPKSARTQLETRDHVVNQDFLSGLFGGITLKQYRAIAGLPGVSVAAPVANVGYFLISVGMFVPFKDLPAPGAGTLYRARVTWDVHKGLARYPGAASYVYYTPSALTIPGYENGYETSAGGKRRDVCGGFFQSSFSPTTPLRPGASVSDPYSAALAPSFTCASPQIRLTGRAKQIGRPGLVQSTDITPSGQLGAYVLFSLPVLVAGVDPRAEQQLVGLKDAVISGSYLKENGGLTAPHTVSGLTKGSPDQRSYPVLASTDTFLDEAATLSIEKLTPSRGQNLSDLLSGADAQASVQRLRGKTVAHYTVTPTAAWRNELAHFNSTISAGFEAGYWRNSSATSSYRRGVVTPKVRRNNPKVWSDTSPTSELVGISLAPPGADDVWYRSLRAFGASGQIRSIDGKRTYVTPAPTLSGTFDPGRLKGFSSLSRVPLQTFYAPTATAGDKRTAKLLAGRPLGPTTNLGGYLSQPPLLLTTIGGAVALDNGSGDDYVRTYSYRGPHGREYKGSVKVQAYSGASPRAPISSVQVRVAGVTGPNTLSLARIKAVAEQIYERTGLTVDITAGSSPAAMTIGLSKGKFGTPPLKLDQGWVKEDVDSAIINALDNKNLALFVLLALSCCFFAIGALQANVRQRHHELTVLVTLGWPARLIALLVISEVAVLALFSGLLGTGIVLGVAQVANLSIPVLRVILITPIVILLGLGAAVVPVRRAAATRPLDALRGRTRASAPGRVRSIAAFALVNLRRDRGRNALAALTLGLAVASATFVLGVQQVFQGSVAHTLLGNAVVVDVHGTDVATVLLVLAVGAGAVSDVLYAAFLERRAEIGLLQTFGWSRRSLVGLMLREGMAVAVGGAVAGAAIAAVGVIVVGSSPLRAIVEAVLGAALGVVVAAFATSVPIWLAIRRTPLQLLSTRD